MTPDIGLGNWLYQRALRTPHRKALTFEGTTWTYAQLQNRIDRLASAFHAHGVCQGDRSAFWASTSPPSSRPYLPQPVWALFSFR